MLYKNTSALQQPYLSKVDLKCKGVFVSESPNDYIEAYLQHMSSSNPNSSFHGKMGLQSLRSSLLDLLLGGAETTSTVLNWALLILTKYPHIQGKVQDELDQVCGRDRLPNLVDRHSLPYTDAVIHEILR